MNHTRTSKPPGTGSTSPPEPIPISEMARYLGKPEWMAARGVARLLAAGLLTPSDGTPREAIASLRNQYGEAVNGR